MRIRTFIAVAVGVLGVIAACAAMPAAQQASAAVALRQAMDTETVKGDLAGAIKQYEAIVSTYGRTDRPVAAQALLRMAELYQKLGDAQARTLYDQLVRDYADQPAVLASARSGLTALPGTGSSQALVTRRVLSNGLDFSYPSISADGRWMSAAIGVRGEVALRDMQTGAVRILTGQPFNPKNRAGAKIFDPILSPDGKRVAYALHTIIDETDEETFELNVLATDDGGKAGTLLRGGGRGNSIREVWPWAWSPDGKSILTEISRRNQTYELVWVSTADGSLTTIKALDWRRQLPHSKMRVSLSPDGRYVAYAALVKNPSSAQVMRQDSSDKHVYILKADGSGESEISTVPGRAEMPVWTTDGSHLLMISGDALWAVPIAGGRPAGDAVLVKRDLANGEPLGMTSSGSYYYSAMPGFLSWLTIRDLRPGGSNTSSSLSEVTFGLHGQAPAWSPTGSEIAYVRRASATEPATVIVRSLAAGKEKTFRGIRTPIWFHDGRHLLVQMDARTAPNGTVYMAALPFGRLDVETGEVTTLPIASGESVGVLSPDDRTLYIRRGLSVVAHDLATGQPRTVYVADRNIYSAPLALSPDGRHLAIPMERSVMWIGIDGGEPRVIATLPDPVTRVAWAPDGRSLLVATLTLPGQVRFARVDPDSGVVEPLELSGNSGGNRYDFSFSPDGKRIVLQILEGGAATPEFFAIDNVSAFLKAAK